MPHDRNGNPISVGDEISIPCIVKQIQPGDEYCNVTVAAKYPMPPYTTEYTLTLNTKQVEKLFSGDVASASEIRK